MMADRRDEECDVLVIGFGGAGACAAIEAADRGASVIVIDRFSGGGATRRSGGVIYGGGGTEVQRRAGFTDTPDKMFRYLRRETGAGVDERTLRAFCASSAENMKWLETMGIAIPGTCYRRKTTQPPGGYGLYFSGNEKQYTADDPVPRGHVPAGAGMSGGAFYQALKRAVLDRGVKVLHRTRARALTVEHGAVTGAETICIGDSLLIQGVHAMLFNIGMASGLARKLISLVEERFGAVRHIRARGGVIISAGGFIYNRAMVAEHAPLYAGCMPLGTPGDDGSGISLGRGAGGALASMDFCAASRFYSPPEAFASGILVNIRGERFCDESLYGATVSRHIAGQPARRAFLIIDEKLRRLGRKQMGLEERLRDFPLSKILSGELNALIFRKAMHAVNSSINRKKARSIPALEKKCGMPPDSLAGTIAGYNERCASGKEDEFGKPSEHVQEIGEPPYYAIDCRLDSMIFPSPCITLGGLAMDGLTSQVLDRSGKPVGGLYAAGRSAAGVCSRSYVSGLSLADCVFSGRNAGKSAAMAAHHHTKA